VNHLRGCRFTTRVRLRSDQSSGGTGAIWLIGIGAQPVSEPPHDECCNATPRLPHAVQQAVCRSMSRQPSGPQRITWGAMATASPTRQLESTAVIHAGRGVSLKSSMLLRASRVGRNGAPASVDALRHAICTRHRQPSRLPPQYSPVRPAAPPVHPRAARARL